MRRVPLAATLFACLIAAGPASAQPTNPGFESGFTGWLLAGTSAATIAGSETGITPTEGLVQAVLSNSSGVADAVLEAFLGLPGATLDGLGNGDATNGSALRQAFSAPAGTIIAFDWNFRTGESTPSFFNDFGFATFNGALRELADTGSLFLGAETGYRSTCFVATGGVDVLGAGVANVGDTAVSSQLFFDNGRVVTDGDGDGVGEPCDNCPGIANPTQADADQDFVGDACDPCFGIGADGDGDAVCDGEDNCPAAANPGQEDGDGDSVGDACDACVGIGTVDTDGDLVCDGFDNCPNVANPGQEDGDGDNSGDACDPCNADPTPFDFDGDGFCGVPAQCPAGCDNCPFDTNATQADTDGDGRGDTCDNCPDVANPTQADDDFDDIGDACDGCFGFGTTDSDGDGQCDGEDNCTTVPNPSQQDSDFDGFGDACDACAGPGINDSDGDGICDETDACVTDPTQACATLFACTNAFGLSELYRINPTTGVGFVIGSMGFSGCSGLEFDAATGILYAVQNASPPSLWRVNTATGSSTVLGPTGAIAHSDLASRADGTLFTLVFPPSAATVSGTTGTATSLGSAGIGDTFGGGLTFSDGGELFYASERLARIALPSGLAVDLGPLAFPPAVCDAPRINGLATDESGTAHALISCFESFFPRFLGTLGLPGGSVSAVIPTVGGLGGIAFAPSGACGDGILNLGEQCDDGNVVGGDCCAPGCTVEAAGTPCSGDPCAVSQCDGIGGCVGAPPADCRGPGKAQLRLQHDSDATKHRLRFTWSKGAAVAASELGDPLQTADYTMCVYAGPARTRIATLTVPAAGGKWSALSSGGFSYKDTGGLAAGVTRLRLKPGPTEKSRAQLLAKGANLPAPFFGNLPLPVRVEMLSDESPTCLGATFSAADVRQNDAGRFTATVK